MALKALAKTLKGLYRSSDLIGRLGGDEFMILLTNVGSIKNLKRIVNDTVVKIAAMEYEQMKAMALTCSIGVVLITDHSENFNTLYNQADIALYMAKWDGKNRYRIYSQRMDKELMLRVKNND
ncbi:putative diguanylate cyclase DgcT [bioreactor metagenome]|uniref:Putative diguanylate cyclase DgcT n=1 Tax=bioreactor metagenome TaxID=1076179 RepID=A0A645FRK7_9ZZZZ